MEEVETSGDISAFLGRGWSTAIFLLALGRREEQYSGGQGRSSGVSELPNLVTSHQSQSLPLPHLVMRLGLRTYSPRAASYSSVLQKRSCWTLDTAMRWRTAPSSGGIIYRRAPSSGGTWSCRARPCPAGRTPGMGTLPGGSRGRRRNWSPVGTVGCRDSRV